MTLARLWVVLALMAGTAWVIHERGDTDKVPPSRPLAEVPEQIGPWVGRDLAISQETLDVLGKGVFLNRVYAPMAPGSAGAPRGEVGLFIGYFPTQRTGQSIHSPQNCLPGSGWTFDSSGVTEVRDRTGRTYRVGEYIISNGVSREEVLYWYQTHGRSVASDYAAKLHMLADSVLYNRTDAALIRVTTPIGSGERQQDAHDRVIRFAEQLTPMLPTYIPD